LRLPCEDVRRIAARVVAEAPTRPLIADPVVVIEAPVVGGEPPVESGRLRAVERPEGVVQKLPDESGPVPPAMKPDRQRVARVREAGIAGGGRAHAAAVRVLAAE